VLTAYTPVALPRFFRYFPPAVAKTYVVTFRSHNDDRPSKFIVLANSMKSAISHAMLAMRRFDNNFRVWLAVSPGNVVVWLCALSLRGSPCFRPLWLRERPRFPTSRRALVTNLLTDISDLRIAYLPADVYKKSA
jgi:hypothetical protein